MTHSVQSARIRSRLYRTDALASFLLGKDQPEQVVRFQCIERGSHGKEA